MLNVSQKTDAELKDNNLENCVFVVREKFKKDLFVAHDNLYYKFKADIIEIISQLLEDTTVKIPIKSGIFPFKKKKYITKPVKCDMSPNEVFSIMMEGSFLTKERSKIDFALEFSKFLEKKYGPGTSIEIFKSLEQIVHNSYKTHSDEIKRYIDMFLLINTFYDVEVRYEVEVRKEFYDKVMDLVNTKFT